MPGRLDTILVCLIMFCRLLHWVPDFASERRPARPFSETPTAPSFPEEPLASSGDEGSGFFPARLGMLLNDSHYEVLRKLGKGQFSSTWLALDSLYVYLFPRQTLVLAHPSHSHPLEWKRGHGIAQSKF